jgi:phosphoribosylformimino-5-aminoimidazole carboxamide ribotide isomerase
VIAIPAIDLRDGACVQLVGGSFDDELIRRPDPLAVAAEWIDAGFTSIHVVDLDAAMGTGSNAAMIDSLLATTTIDVQIGGGIRTTAAVARWLDRGARRVVVGTRALRDPTWLSEISNTWPERIVVAADSRNGRAVANGWTTTLARTAIDVIAELASLPLAGFLVTAVDREGQMLGPDLGLVAEAVRATTRPIVASGGVGSINDLVAVAACGAAATVIGMALYSGALDPRTVAREFAS